MLRDHCRCFRTLRKSLYCLYVNANMSYIYNDDKYYICAALSCALLLSAQLVNEWEA